jgi:hypothetical protein
MTEIEDQQDDEHQQCGARDPEPAAAAPALQDLLGVIVHRLAF